MQTRHVGLALVVGLLPMPFLSLGCDPGPTPWVWELPPGFPEPAVPADNPMNEQKVELGRHLFYDKRLSGNGTQSCGSCHDQARAFTDGKARAVGSTEEIHPRSSMSLVNVAYASTLTWANPTVRQLERQALVPMFGERPVELGLAGQEDALLERLRKDDQYPEMFAVAFADDPAGADDADDDADEPVTLDRITRSIAAFERTLISGRSPFDRYANAEDPNALSESQKRGMGLFFSEELECFHCHGGFVFADSVRTATSQGDVAPFHNTGLYNLDGNGAYPEGGTGVFDITGVATDMGRFKAPTLRNIAVTAPYMHDGSIATLEEVIDHYAAGGRTIAEGDNAGVGSENPYKSGFVAGFTLTAEQKADVIAFLESLTDDELLADPRYADPFAAAEQPE